MQHQISGGESVAEERSVVWEGVQGAAVERRESLYKRTEGSEGLKGARGSQGGKISCEAVSEKVL